MSHGCGCCSSRALGWGTEWRETGVSKGPPFPAPGMHHVGGSGALQVARFAPALLCGKGVPAGTGPWQGWVCCSGILLSSSSWQMLSPPCIQTCSKPLVKTAGRFSSTSLHKTRCIFLCFFSLENPLFFLSLPCPQVVTVEPLNLQMLKAFILTAMSLIDPQCQYIKPPITLLLCAANSELAVCSLSIETTNAEPGISHHDFAFKGVQGSVCPSSQCCCQQLVKQHRLLHSCIF